MKTKLLNYGVTSDLALKAEAAGLSVTKIRSLSQKDMVSKFGLSTDEAKFISRCVKRNTIEVDIAQYLLERSNFVCCICKGSKGLSYIIHHIVEYEKTQDNSYENLVVLCPADHDLAHQSGLTLKISPNQLRKSKFNWEKQVESENARKAAQAIKVKDDAVDYINVNRIEELCIRLFDKIPLTTRTESLQAAGILGTSGSFDQINVQNNLSGGRYLFDYITHQESSHYKQLMQKISDSVNFLDLDKTARQGQRELERSEGQYAFFIGGVSAKNPIFPFTQSTPYILLHYSRRRLRIEWILDPNFLMSMSSIVRIGGKNRYIIYCLIRTVETLADKSTLIKASPLFIAQPIVWVDKIPLIAYQRQYAEYNEDDEIDDEV